jgi:hypothetical protein
MLNIQDQTAVICWMRTKVKIFVIDFDIGLPDLCSRCFVLE